MVSTYLEKDDEFNEICNLYKIDSKECRMIDRVLCGDNEHLIFSITIHQNGNFYIDIYHFIRPAYSKRPFEFIMRKNGQEITRKSDDELFENLCGYCGKTENNINIELDPEERIDGYIDTLSNNEFSYHDKCRKKLFTKLIRESFWKTMNNIADHHIEIAKGAKEIQEELGR